MSVTLTVTGTEGILASLQDLSSKLSGPELVTELGVMASAEIHQAAPIGRRGDAGLLQRTLSEMSPVESTGDGWRVGVGNLEGIYPLKTPRRGTIAAFLKKWAEEHGEAGEGKAKMPKASIGKASRKVRRGGSLGGFHPRRTVRRRKVGTSFNPRKAWWYLSEEQKVRLREMRESGEEDVGGASPYRPFYWYVQDQGSAGADIKGSKYLVKAIHIIKGRIGSTILKVLGREGGGPIITGYNQ